MLSAILAIMIYIITKLVADVSTLVRIDIKCILSTSEGNHINIFSSIIYFVVSVISFVRKVA
jgi:hypothetical protein